MTGGHRAGADGTASACNSTHLRGQAESRWTAGGEAKLVLPKPDPRASPGRGSRAPSLVSSGPATCYEGAPAQTSLVVQLQPSTGLLRALTAPVLQLFPSDVPSCEKEERPVLGGVGRLEFVPQAELPLLLQLQAHHCLAQ